MATSSSSTTTVIEIPESTGSELKELTKTPVSQSPAAKETTAAASPASTSSSKPVVIDKTMSSIANLVKLLPSGTVLAFQALDPTFTNHGVCYTSNKYLTSLLLFLCAATCLFFTFTDSLLGSDGKLYYGIALPKGFYVFNYDGTDEDQSKVFGDSSKYRVRLLDCVHAFFGVLVFFSVAFSDTNVQNCFFSDAGANSKELLMNLPLGAGFFSSIVFLIFPTTRKGIGYSDTSSNSN